MEKLHTDLSKRAKEYLAQIGKTDRLIQRMKDAENTLRSSLTSRSYEIRPDKVHTSRKKDTLEDDVARIVSLEDEINARIIELAGMKQDVFRMICRIHDLDQQNVLIGRYIQMKKWEDLAEDFGCTTQWVFVLHKRALQFFCVANADFLGTCQNLLST